MSKKERVFVFCVLWYLEEADLVHLGVTVGSRNAHVLTQIGLFVNTNDAIRRETSEVTCECVTCHLQHVVTLLWVNTTAAFTLVRFAVR